MGCGGGGKPNFAAISAQAKRDGLWVLPACLDCKAKHPTILWKEFQQRRPTDDEQSFWLARHPSRNGVYTTGALLGRFVLDCDSKAAVAWAMRKGMPKTQTVNTRRGKHFHFAHPGFRVGNTSGKIHAFVDIRGDGGIAVGVGSIHWTGSFVYQWARSRSPRDVKLAKAPAWLLDWLREREQRRAQSTVRQAIAQPFKGIVSPWAAAVIDGELATLAATPCGARNDALARCAFKLGQIAGGGEADGDELRDAILEIARAWPSFAKSSDTVRRAFDAGEQHPRSAPSLWDSLRQARGVLSGGWAGVASASSNQ
jgi:Bifunctional DNA primase/polymerase, N-terminal